MTRPPNILWIVADHQVHASRPPGFDRFPLQRRLAQAGTRFNRAYSVLPICSPARASMLTGLYPHAHGLTENDGRFGGREGLEPSDWMLHRPLLERGYRCGWFGKWHVDNRRSALDYGFEGFSLPGYGNPYHCSEYLEYLDRLGLDKPVAEIVIPNESGIAPGSGIDLTRDSRWYDCVSGVARVDQGQAHEACFVGDLAATWLDSVGDEPFFLRVDPWGPHPPYLLAEPFFGMLDACDLQLPANFFDALEHRPEHHRRYREQWSDAVGLDEQQWRLQYQHALEHVILVESALCRLLEHVDLDNTVVIFNSDHGDAVGSNGGVANKGDLMVEATMRIPLVIAGPGIMAGQRREELVNQLDLVATVLGLCDVDCNRPLHGDNLLPLLQAGRAAWRNGQMAQHYGLQEPILQRAWYRDQLKLVMGEDGFVELYDLSVDPQELRNLALEAKHGNLMASMQSELIRARQASGDTDSRLPIALP